MRASSMIDQKTSPRIVLIEGEYGNIVGIHENSKFEKVKPKFATIATKSFNAS